MQSVFLIEDDSDDQKLFAEALYRVSPVSILSIAGNGKEALDFLKNAILQPNIIFSDINMPVMDGIQFLKEFRSSNLYTSIPIVMLSTSITTDQIEKEITLFKNVRFYRKPNCFENLCMIIKETFVWLTSISEYPLQHT